MKNNRLHLLDTVRGITVLSMVFYHTLWDVVYIYGKDLLWYRGPWGYIWQQSICWTFILLSGFCVGLSKNIFKRGLVVFLSGVLVSAATYIFTPSSKILFGVLTLIGSSMLICAATKKLLKKIPPIIGGSVSVLLFLVFRNCNEGYLGFETLNIVKLPDTLYKNLFTAYLGFPPRWFLSADYFSLFPWMFLFLTGYFLHNILEKCGLKEKLFIGGRIEPFAFIGKNSLIIYLLHQLVIYLILNIIM